VLLNYTYYISGYEELRLKKAHWPHIPEEFLVRKIPSNAIQDLPEQFLDSQEMLSGIIKKEILNSAPEFIRN
jgi:hypothetical protein